MSAGYFVLAILGCADGGSACTTVATLPTRYASEAQCVDASVPTLAEHSDFDFPTLLARCRQGNGKVGRVTHTRKSQENALGR